MTTLRERLVQCLGQFGPGFGLVGARRRCSILEAEYVVVDTELTGLDLRRDELLSLGAIRLRGAAIRVGESFYRTIRPAREDWRATVSVHRILPGDVADAAPAGEVLQELDRFAGEAIWVGHFVQIDRRFLAAARAGAGLAPDRAVWLDSRRAAGWLASHRRVGSAEPDPETAEQLERLARHYDIAIPTAHHAMADAYVTAQVWQRLLWALHGHGVRSLGELAAIAGA